MRSGDRRRSRSRSRDRKSRSRRRDRSRRRSRERERSRTRDSSETGHAKRPRSPSRSSREKRDAAPLEAAAAPSVSSHVARGRQSAEMPRPDFGGPQEGQTRRSSGGMASLVAGDDGGKHEWGKHGEEDEEEDDGLEKEKPNFGLSGALAKDSKTGNTVNGVVLKFNEPPEARMPDKRWRFYVYKGAKELEVLHMHRKSAYLVGRDEAVCHLVVRHPSCSKQHAVLQYRQRAAGSRPGSRAVVIKPYLMDLDSTNGTFLNNERIEPARYYEVLTGDVIKFGESTREYVAVCVEAVPAK